MMLMHMLDGLVKSCRLNIGGRKLQGELMGGYGLGEIEFNKDACNWAYHLLGKEPKGIEEWRKGNYFSVR